MRPNRARRRRSRSTSIASSPNAFSRARRWTTRGSRSWRGRSRRTASSSRSSCARDGDRFQIIAGERRWRAAQRAGLLRVPVVVREVAAGQERSLLEMALIENIQRENLNPIDEALAYRRLSDEFQLTQEDIADGRRQGPRVGRQLPAAAEAARGGPAPRSRRARCRWATRARCSSLTDEADQRRVARDVIARQPLGARDRVAGQEDRRRRAQPARDAGAEAGRRAYARGGRPLRLALGTRVRIVRQGTRGRIEIDFGSEDELIRIYEQLTQ